MWLRATNKHNARCDGIGALCTHTRSPLGAHRPGASERKASSKQRIEEGLPSRARDALTTHALRLLEGIIDCDWKGRVCLLHQTAQRLRHALKKEAFGASLAI